MPAVALPFTDHRNLGVQEPARLTPMLGEVVREQRARSRQPTEFTLVTDRAGFAALEADWNALFERAGRDTQVFQGFNWAWHWCNHYLPPAHQARRGVSLSIVVGRRNGRVAMIWPLVAERRGGIKQLFWMGEPVSQYGDVLVEDGPDAARLLREAWSYIKTIGADVVRLRKVRADAAIAPLLAEIGARCTQQLEAPYLDLTTAEDFAAYEQRFATKSRRNRRRLARRLEERGVLGFSRQCGGTASRELAARAIELKRRWLRDRGLVSPAFAEQRMAGFFAAAAEGAQRPTGCRVSTLTFNGEPVAFEIGFGCKGRLAVHVMAYDLSFEKAGVGVLLIEEAIRSCYADGFGRYDLLAPRDGYKMDWADGSVAVSDWAIPLSVAGKAYTEVYLGFVRRRIKAAIDALPASLRRLVATSYTLALTA